MDDNKPADQSASPQAMLVRPELIEFANKELRRQIRLANVRTPAGLGRLFPGLGTKRKK